jgi:hypothetical protein
MQSIIDALHCADADLRGIRARQEQGISPSNDDMKAADLTRGQLVAVERNIRNIQRDLKLLLDYCEHDEQKHFEEVKDDADCDRRGHIIHPIRRLRIALE